jgi:YVTN family beta-propeller protein
MKRTTIAVFALVLCAFGIGVAAKRSLDSQRRLPNQPATDGSTTLPNGWRITPAGHHVPLPGDLPMKMFATRDGNSVIVSTGGYHDHSLSVVDVKSARIVSTVDLVKTWDGMAVDPASGAVYLSGGGHAQRGFAEALVGLARPKMAGDLEKPVLRVNFHAGALDPAPALTIAGLDEKNRYISGITLGPDGSLYVLNIETDTIYRLSGVDFTRQVSGKTGYRPHSSVFSPDGASLAVSCWGDESVGILDPATLQEKARIKVGSHPNEMIWASDGRLFVANSGSNSVSVIAGGQVTETIRTSLDAKSLVGSTPDALALSPDGKRLYVANADNNNVAVIDTPGGRQESRVAGFIPTGWYPTALAISPDGRQIYVGTGKGMGFRNNYPAQKAAPQKAPNPQTPYDYIGNVLTGAVSIIAVPDAAQLAAYTKQAVANVPAPSAYVDSALAARIDREVFPKIKHVVYIIRENRTYDQVLGDLGVGNGDPKLVLFGEKVTPNAHSLSRHFVTLDNLYCNGEVVERSLCDRFQREGLDQQLQQARRTRRRRAPDGFPRRLPLGQLRAAQQDFPHLRRDGQLCFKPGGSAEGKGSRFAGGPCFRGLAEGEERARSR